jgi:hypothetical protein
MRQQAVVLQGRAMQGQRAQLLVLIVKHLAEVVEQVLLVVAAHPQHLETEVLVFAQPLQAQESFTLVVGGLEAQVQITAGRLAGLLELAALVVGLGVILHPVTEAVFLVYPTQVAVAVAVLFRVLPARLLLLALVALAS